MFHPALYRSLSNTYVRGVETTLESGNAHASWIASCLVGGFVLMVIIEQLVAPNAHSHAIDVPLPMHKIKNAPVEFDVELDEAESSRQRDLAAVNDPDIQNRSPSNEKAFALLLGLVIHGVADGLALGVASLATKKDGDSKPISFIIFLALMLHKGTFPQCIFNLPFKYASVSAHRSGFYHLLVINQSSEIKLQEICWHI